MDSIELVAYNPQWKLDFDTEKKWWQSILSSNLVACHHIGSTAIEGILAKPVIDILIEVHSLVLLDKLNFTIENYGYEVKGEYGITGRRYFQKFENGKRKFHVHCYVVGDKEVQRHIKFRNKLNSQPNLALEYNSLKIKLAEQYKNDRIAYTKGKSEFINRIINE